MEKIKCNNCNSENLPNARYCSRCGFELPKVEKLTNEIPLVVRPKKKKYQFEYIFGIVLGVLVYFAIQNFFFNSPALNKDLTEAAKEINKSCPMMMDSLTRLDNVEVLPDNVFQYNYTLLHTEAINIEGLKNALEPSLVNFIRTSPQMKYQRENKTTLAYFYKDSNSVFLFSITITPDKYEQANQEGS